MSLETGARLGPYEILGPLGAGGMGEVYRARDTKLGRAVAIKLLPETFATDPQRVARFQREAQALAALNHPYIAQIYGLEDSTARPALVMELVEGATLADRLSAGRLPVAETIVIARQIAEAVEAAHEKGIIHRDLKPGNVMVTADGGVKVLDFGLAAVTEAAGPPAGDVTHSPTLSMAATLAGVILGTAAYMSPEQAVGKPADKRADIWSFGVVLWEMLSGRRLFQAETVAHTLADVLRTPIDFEAVPGDTPPRVRELLQRCLDRDPRTRLRDIGEARVALTAAFFVPAPESTPVPARGSSRTVAAVSMVAAVAVASTLVLAFVHFREPTPTGAAVRFEVLPPDDSRFNANAAVSPDGRYLAFSAPGPDGISIWLRALDSSSSRRLPGTTGAGGLAPFWSPDSRFLAYAGGSGGRLRKVDVTGGAPLTITAYPGAFRQGAWSPAGFIIYGSQGAGLMRISDAGGTSTPVTVIDNTHGEQHSEPAFLPDGRRFLYLKTFTAGEANGIFVGDSDASPEKQDASRLLVADSGAIFAPSSAGSVEGHLLYLREGTLLAHPFDARRVQFLGEAIPLAEDVGVTVSTTGSRHGWFSASQNGLLSYRSGGAAALSELVWFDRQGKRLGQVGAAADYGLSGVFLSRDGRRVTTQRLSGITREGSPQSFPVWIADTVRGVFSPLPGDGVMNGGPISPNGRVAITSTVNGALGDLYWVSATGVGSLDPLLVQSPTVKHVNHFSWDGRFLIYDDHSPKQFQDLWVLDLSTGSGAPLPNRKPIPFVVTPADEAVGQFSPDDRWVAYSSNESGRREVYVQGFAPDQVPAAAVGKWQVSTAGGDKPKWSHDGKELYYLALDGTLMAAPVKLGSTFEVGVPTPLFETDLVGFFPYEVAPDDRFLMLTPAAGASTASPVTVILNWRAGLRR